MTPDGELYVSDGYGQQRVHRFGSDGALNLAGEYSHEGQKVRERLTVQKQEEGQLKLTSALALGDGAEMKTVAESILTAAKP